MYLLGGEPIAELDADRFRRESKESFIKEIREYETQQQKKEDSNYLYVELDEEEIDIKEYQKIIPPKRMKIIYTKHFDDDLWKGYPSIEPTERMREYVKPE